MKFKWKPQFKNRLLNSFSPLSFSLFLVQKDVEQSLKKKLLEAKLNSVYELKLTNFPEDKKVDLNIYWNVLKINSLFNDFFIVHFYYYAFGLAKSALIIIGIK
jgi:hypothetical protein